MSFIMYGVCDAEGNLLRGDRLDRHLQNKGADWKFPRKGDPAAQWERSKKLQDEALRLTRLRTKPVTPPEPAPETNYTPELPPARWNQHALSLRSPWRAAQTGEED